MTFQQLYNEYSNLSYNLALQYLQNKEDAEEVVQDVFVSIHQNLSKFENHSTYSTWIYRITVNKCLDLIKSQNRKKRFAYIQSIYKDDTIEIRHESTEFNHPGVVLEQKESIKRIFHAINTLKTNQKTAIILHKIEHLSQQEIADIMEISPKAVESLIQRAKQNLYKILEYSRDKG